MTMGHTVQEQVESLCPTNVNNCPQSQKKKGGGVYGQGPRRRRGGRRKGRYSGYWMPAKIKKEGKREINKGRQRSFIQLEEVHVKRNIHQDTENNSYGRGQEELAHSSATFPDSD